MGDKLSYFRGNTITFISHNNNTLMAIQFLLVDVLAIK
jgi:hypothetical protein